MKKTVIIPKIGTYIDGGIGGFYVTKDYQKRKIQEAKDAWKRDIQCQKSLVSETVLEPLPHFEYSYEDNPYYGSSENELEIIVDE